MLLLSRIDEDEVSSDDREPLEQHSHVTSVLKIADGCHLRIEHMGNVRHEVFEPGEERWIVERPLRRTLECGGQLNSFKEGTRT